jgi:hypothetical protein
MIGVVSGTLLYRWDIVYKQLLKSVTIPTDVCVATQAPTGAITVVVGSKDIQSHPPTCRGLRVVRIDPVTLTGTLLGTLPGPVISNIVQRWQNLYASIGADLYAIH